MSAYKIAYVWLRLGLDESIEDFDPDTYPHWLTEEISEFGWNTLLVSNPELFPLKNGIAPLQWFLVKIQPTAYTKDYWGEWDSDLRVEIVRVNPVPPEEALNHLQRYYREATLFAKPEPPKEPTIPWRCWEVITYKGVVI